MCDHWLNDKGNKNIFLFFFFFFWLLLAILGRLWIVLLPLLWRLNAQLAELPLFFPLVNGDNKLLLAKLSESSLEETSPLT